MRLICQRRFKSVHFRAPIDLPKFTVLTGVNGAGKSHLLQAIEEGAVVIEGVQPNIPNRQQTIRRFDWNTLSPQDTGPFSAAQIGNEQSSYWNEIASLQGQFDEQFLNSIRQLQAPVLNEWGVSRIKNSNIEQLQGAGLDLETATRTFESIRQLLNNFGAQVRDRFTNNDPQNRTRFIEAIDRNRPADFFVMNQNEFYERIPRLWQPVDLFQQSFARLFTAYQRLDTLNLARMQGRAKGDDVEALEDAAFVEKFGTPPWDFVNDLLETAALDLRINQPSKYDDRPYEPTLTDAKRGTEVKFNDLSSGEKILMSFVLCLYHASEPTAAKDFPRVLLFDEIDAPLHPSMTRSLLRTIEETLVGKHAISVILTTHSPSTVALAPDSSIHVMMKSGEPRLRQDSKDRALGILTAGVPTLSVSFENRRQVFVESKYDVEYYSAIYERCRTHLNPVISLIFIPSAAAGNCDQVITTVRGLFDAGARTVRGSIDWDSKHRSAGPIRVLGENERHTIENFILDPLLIGLLLLHEKFVTPAELGLPEEANYRALDKYLDSHGQTVTDNICARLFAAAEDARIDLQYCSGLQVSAPRTLAVMPGHDLERRIKEVFPELNRFHNENELKTAVTTIVLDDYPQLIPVAFRELFLALQAE